MAQTIIAKELINTALANNNGGWIYCSGCNQTIGYLCYTTYSRISLEYTCKCGNAGSISIKMEEEENVIKNSSELKIIKNRLCCPEDHSPLITILKNKLEHYAYHIVCKTCHNEYIEP
jgi:hypothetical protein